MKDSKSGDNGRRAMTDREELRENIRKNLIALRKIKGASQADIAMYTDKKNTTVASWEQGISLPDITTLYRLSEYYNVMMEYFMQSHDEEEQK